jgi:NTP pyrophosphatase (non-canonical NTP hydrolase)
MIKQEDNVEQPDLWEKLKALNVALERRFPKGNDPFQMMTRLLEECGELATEVHIFEDSGVKRKKHGAPDKMRMAQEVKGVLLCALQIVRYYAIEEDLVATIEQSYQKAHNEGLI